MDAEVSIGVKVVIFGRHVLSVGLLAAFCLATRDLGGGEWEQMGSHLGAPHRFGSLQAGLHPLGVYRTTPQTVPRQPYSPHLPSCLSQEPPHPQSTIQEGTPDTSARPTISPVSAPVSSSAHSWGREGRGRRKRGRHREGQRWGGGL